MMFKKLFLSIFAFIALAMGLATSASAGCDYGLECTTTVNTTINSSPSPAPTVNYTVGGGVDFWGSGAAVFVGDEGFAMAKKKGYGGVDTTLTAGGNLCGGVNCQSGTITFTGYAGEHVETAAGALSTTPGGAQAAVANYGSAYSAVNFNIKKALGAQ